MGIFRGLNHNLPYQIINHNGRELILMRLGFGHNQECSRCTQIAHYRVREPDNLYQDSDWFWCGWCEKGLTNHD